MVFLLYTKKQRFLKQQIHKKPPCLTVFYVFVAGTGIAPVPPGYEPGEVLLLHPAIAVPFLQYHGLVSTRKQKYTLAQNKCVVYNSVMQNIKKIIILYILLGVLFPASFVNAGLLLGERDRERSEEQGSVMVSEDTSKWRMAYYVGYQNEYLKPKDIDYSLITHIVVGAVGVRADGSLREHWHMSNGDGREMALDIGKRADRAGVKKLIWLGGPNEEDLFYSATEDAVRKTFVRAIMALVRDIGYDGVDINWEPIRKNDEERIVALVRDLRAEDPNLLITVPVNWVTTTTITQKDLSRYKELSTYADRLFIMSYSMAGPWQGWRSWHSSALLGDTLTTPSSVRISTLAYTRAGVPKEKLGIGIGTYATCWKYPITRVKQKIPEGYYSKNMSVMSMRTMMDEYYRKRSERFDSRANVPYLSFSRAYGPQDCGFISYENERSVAEKARYVIEEGLGGVMVWNIGTGYFPEATRTKRHPYLKAIQDVFTH